MVAYIVEGQTLNTY